MKRLPFVEKRHGKPTGSQVLADSRVAVGVGYLRRASFFSRPHGCQLLWHSKRYAKGNQVYQAKKMNLMELRGHLEHWLLRIDISIKKGGSETSQVS